MIIRAIKFTRETLPMIYAEYPAVEGRWDKSMLFDIEGEEHYFVYDAALSSACRVITREHFEDVYEIPASEIGNTFKRIY